MYYDGLANDHGLPHDPIKGLVIPRPIGWISSLSPDGTANLAPYSYFNLVGDKPGIVMFSSSTRKDSIANAEATGEFACNFVSYPLRDAMNASSAAVPPDVDEFEVAGLTRAPCNAIAAPRVAEAHAVLECRYIKTVDLPDGKGGKHIAEIVLGIVVGVHIDDRVIVDGKVDATKLHPVARLGYMDYAAVNEVFAMTRPKV